MKMDKKVICQRYCNNSEKSVDRLQALVGTESQSPFLVPFIYISGINTLASR